MPKLVQTFDDPDRHGVHLLFNEWWEHALQGAIDACLAALRATPGVEAFLAERFLAPPLTLEELRSVPAGSLVRGCHDFLTEHGLEKNLATNYKMLHDFMASSGRLDRMPEELRHAVIRGFQIHDIVHVVTGYTPSRLDELSLQAFCLAQRPFPYFGMWMSTTTTRMTFLEPRAIRPVMDAISEGWRFGRSSRNLQFERWESRFGQPLVEARESFGIPAGGIAALRD